jgi:hypothetical protein
VQVAAGGSISTVIAALDPAIHHDFSAGLSLRIPLRPGINDARVEPAHDAIFIAAERC